MSLSTIFNVGISPSNVAITPDGRRGYVTNANNPGIPGSYSVSVLDLEKNLPIFTIEDPSFIEPYRIAIDSEGRRAFVTNSGTPNTIGGTGTVSVIDLKTNTVVVTITGFDGPSGIVVGRHKAYVTNYGGPKGVGSDNGTTVSVINLETLTIESTITVAKGPVAVALSKHENFLCVVSYVDGKQGTGILTTIKTKNNQVISTLSGLFGPFSIVLNKNNTEAWITCFGSNDFSPYGTFVSVVNLFKNKIKRNITTGIQPSGIALTDKYAFVSNYNAIYGNPVTFANLTYGQGTVSIIRLKDYKLIAPTVPVGQTPATITLSPDKRRLFVCKYSQNTVEALDLEYILPHKHHHSCSKSPNKCDKDEES